MKTIKFRRAHFIDAEKTKFNHYTEWGVNVGHGSFASPSQNNYAMYFKDYQFTGLKDKNDKEIYEGDIVKILDMILKIVFTNGAFVCDNDISFSYIIESTDYEIIGNIHKNKDLLK